MKYRVFALLSHMGRLLMFLGRSAECTLTPPWSGTDILQQIYLIGARSMPFILASGLFVGMVLSLQFHDTLVRFGSTGLLGSAVGLSLIRELGPVLTALLIIGRCGSALCAEIGMMRHDNQIDALKCMAIDPIRFLVAPRLLATLISVPLLTAIFIIAGVFGGYIVGVFLFDTAAGTYFDSMSNSILLRDQIMCLCKALVFSLFIVWIATANGYYLHLLPHGNEGTAGVSRITTDTVVISSILVLYADYVISALLTF